MPSDRILLDLIVTGSILVLEVALFVVCYIRSKQPVDPAKPRIIPYALIMIILAAAILATLAHLVSVVTGQQVQPRRPKGMR